MSTSNNAPCISEILTEAIPATPATLPAAAMTQTEEIAELTRQNEASEAAKEAAEKRAAERYKTMVHANRRAERTEQALRIEKWERQDDSLKAFRLYSVYKEEIKNLRLELAQTQQSGPSVVHLQELQTANVRLEVQLSQHKEAAARAQISHSNALNHIRAKTEADKQQFQEQSEKEYQKRLAGREKQLKDEFSRQSAAAIKKLTKKHESTLEENKRLKQQFRQSQQALEWYKDQIQQQSAQRTSYEGMPTAAGIHAGFPLSAQHSPAQVTDQARKHRRLNSTGDMGIPTSEHQQGHGNTATTPTKRKVPRGSSQLSQHPPTPTRLPQHPNISASPLQSFQQAQAQAQAQAQLQAQAQAVLFQAQRAGTHQLFLQFISHTNAEKKKIGLPQLTVIQLWPVFNQWMAARASPQQSAPISSHVDSQSIMQRNMSSMQSSREGPDQVAQQSPSLPMATPLGQQSFQFGSTQLPLSNQANGYRAAQLMQRPQQCQQSPQALSQSASQPLAMSSHDSSSMPTLTAGHNEKLSAMSPDNTLQVQATPQQMYPDIADMELAAQLSAQLQDENMYPSAEDSQGTQDKIVSIKQGEITGWASPTPRHEGSSHESHKQASFNEFNLQDFGIDPMYIGFSAATNNAVPLPCHSQNMEAPPNTPSQQQGATSLSQQTLQQFVDPALLHTIEAQDTNGNFEIPNPENLTHSQHSTPHQRQPSEAPSIISIRSSHPPPDHPPTHPPTSRKRPVAAPPSSARSTPAPSTRSTPAPAGPIFPVCLHCHENWWNETCDVGEPRRNCIGRNSQCERPKCHHEAGTCHNARCPRVHEGDMRFVHVVQKPKTLKRNGKKDSKQPSPVDLARWLQ